jgi:hypothetical protein
MAGLYPATHVFFDPIFVAGKTWTPTDFDQTLIRGL